jgi:hypothetical protein
MTRSGKARATRASVSTTAPTRKSTTRARSVPANGARLTTRTKSVPNASTATGNNRSKPPTNATTTVKSSTRTKRSVLSSAIGALPAAKRQRKDTSAASKADDSTEQGRPRQRVARKLDPSFIDSNEIDHSEDESESVDDDSEDDEEYEVTAVLDERGGEVMVQWSGIDPATGEPWEPTWVPESDSFKDLLDKYRRSLHVKPASPSHSDSDTAMDAEDTAIDADDPATDTAIQAPSTSTAIAASSTLVVCAICKESGGVGRECLRCNAPVHHFCVVDLGAKLKAPESEFGDHCFCSKECYEGLPKRTIQAGSKPIQAPAKPIQAAPKPVNVPLRPKALQRKVKDKEASKPKPMPKTTNIAQGKKPATKTKEKEPDHIFDMYIGKHVAFAPVNETFWMNPTLYQSVGSTYLQGVISRTYKKEVNKKKIMLFEIKWTVSDHHSSKHVHGIPLDKVKQGMIKYNELSQTSLSGENWMTLTSGGVEHIPLKDSVWDDFEEVPDDFRYVPEYIAPSNVLDVEEINGMDFDPNAVLNAPEDLYTHEDGTTTTRLKPQFKHIFEHSASSSFFAFLPLSFWRKVVEESNAYAAGEKRPAITLDEMMKFLGILFYMAVVDKGEYSNYWGEQVENKIFEFTSVSLDNIMSLRRFKFIRKNLCFNNGVSSTQIKSDPLARIRPLVNILKLRGMKYADIGRNVAVDETSIASRSRYARHLIVYNPT